MKKEFVPYDRALRLKAIRFDEPCFGFYKRGTADSFREGLYNLFFKADTINQIKLETMWPELSVLRRYSNEPGYWENLQERYKIPNKMGITKS